MFSKITKGQVIALTAILKMRTARSSGENLSRIGKGKYGTDAQLADVALIVMLFMFSRLTFFVPCVCSAEEEAVRVYSLTARLLVFQLSTIYDYFIAWNLHLYNRCLAYCLTFWKLAANINNHPLKLSSSFSCFLKRPHLHLNTQLQKSI